MTHVTDKRYIENIDFKTAMVEIVKFLAHEYLQNTVIKSEKQKRFEKLVLTFIPSSTRN